MLAARARALIDGRLSPSIDDVVALAAPVLRHRMALTFAARADGVDMAQPHRPAGRAAALMAARLPSAPARRRGRRRAAAAARRRRARRGHGGAGRARPAPGRAGRDLLAVPPIRAGRSRHAHRLARERQVAAALRARDRMGGGAERLSVARRLGLDGLRLRPATCRPSGRAPIFILLALAVLLIRGGERVTILGARSGAVPWPRGARAHGAHHRARAYRRRACPISSRCRAMAISC